MDPLDPRNNIELVLEQERKWMYSLNWEALGLIGYEARHTYCAMLGDDLCYDLQSWEATTKLIKIEKKTL